LDFDFISLLTVEKQVIVLFNLHVIAAFKRVKQSFITLVIVEYLLVLASKSYDTHAFFIYYDEVMVLLH